MNIFTTRFGDIAVDETRIIRMNEGMLGFEHLKRYILITQDNETPFMWFQSVDDGSLAFVVIHSFVVKDDYEPVISDEDTQLLDLSVSAGPEEVVVLSVVTIRSDPFTVTANLRAPIVVNVKKMVAKQVVLAEDEYPVQHPLTGTRTNLTKNKHGKHTTLPTMSTP